MPSLLVADTRELLVPRWLPQVEGEIQCSSKFPSKVIEPVGLKRYKKVSTAPEIDVDLHTTTYNFAPNEYRGVVNSSSLAVYKGSTHEINVELKVKTESKLRV